MLALKTCERHFLAYPWGISSVSEGTCSDSECLSNVSEGLFRDGSQTPDGVEWSPALGGWRVLIGMNEPVDMTLVFGKSAVHKDRYPLQYLSITIAMKKGKPALLPSEPRGCQPTK